jgi:hypothetical protein
MKSFMNELLAFQEGFKFKPKTVTQGVASQNQTLPKAKTQIQSMRKAQ